MVSKQCELRPSFVGDNKKFILIESALINFVSVLFSRKDFLLTKDI